MQKERARTINNAHFSSISLYRQGVDVPRSFLECRYYFGSLRPQKVRLPFDALYPPKSIVSILFCIILSLSFSSVSLSRSIHLSMFLCLFFDYDSVPPPRCEIDDGPIWGWKFGGFHDSFFFYWTLFLFPDGIVFDPYSIRSISLLPSHPNPSLLSPSSHKCVGQFPLIGRRVTDLNMMLDILIYFIFTTWKKLG